MSQAIPSRPPLIRATNGVGRALSKVGLGRPRFQPDLIRAAAEKMSGFSDYGSESYASGLAILCHSMENEAELNQMGRFVLHRQVVAALAGRLTIVAWEKANPEAAKATIKAPLIVLGLPRTGTTILYETLAAAPDSRAPLTWECRDYGLAHDIADSTEEDPRLTKLGKQMSQVDRLMPGFSAIHKFGPYVPTECIGLTLLDMASEQFCAMAWLPTYREFLLNDEISSAYSWHKRGLRYFQSTQPEKSWVLKTPMHTGYLGELLKVYPDADLIQTHRDPMEVISSVANLYRVSRGGWSDVENTPERAADDAAYYAEFVHRSVAFRNDNPDQAARFVDIPFRTFVKDPMTQIQKIYEHFGRDYTDEAATAMKDYLTNRPREKYGKHIYSPEQFGFTKETYDPVFAEYVEQYASYL
ncbi:MAG: sulfotransferase [Hyphomonadaceae bacterium]